MVKKPEEIKKGNVCCGSGGCDGCPYRDAEHGKDSCCDVLTKDTLTYIQKLEAQVPRWISAKTPPKDWRKNDKDKTLINYQVYSPDYGVDIGNWIETAEMWVVMGVPAKVTHWMPLPEAPKEVET